MAVYGKLFWKEFGYKAAKFGYNLSYWLRVIDKDQRKQKRTAIKESFMDARARYILEYTRLRSMRYVEKYYLDYAKNRKTNKVIYTCITGGYDFLNHHNYIDKDWDYVCFCDDPEMLKHEYVGAWKILPLAFDELDNVRNARWHKVHPHEILKEYDYSIWCDGNVNFLTSHGVKRAEGFIKDNVMMAVPRHFKRSCIYDEAKVCIVCKKDSEELIQEQTILLNERGFPTRQGLHETNVVFRKHNDLRCVEMMSEWWCWIRDVSKRDQLSFDYVLWHNKLEIVDFCEKPIKLMPRHYAFIYMLDVHSFKV